MIFSGRRLLLSLAIVVVAMGIVILIEPVGRWLAWVVAGSGLVMIVVLNVLKPPAPMARTEPDSIEGLTETRRRELVRGTSLYLREMRYRYSVRVDTTDQSDRSCFTAEVNTIRLGFVPVVIMDNSSDSQGFGYVAFVYDSKRWRGPGLPCPGERGDALEHAAKCVSPLSDADETEYV